jgi:hypothetical protein
MLALVMGVLCQLAGVFLHVYVGYLVINFFFANKEWGDLGEGVKLFMEQLQQINGGEFFVFRYSTPGEIQISLMLIVAIFGLILLLKGVGILITIPLQLYQLGSSLLGLSKRGRAEPSSAVQSAASKSTKILNDSRSDINEEPAT